MPFQPGQSGNPAGSPPNAKLFRQALQTALKKADGDVEKIQRIADKIVEQAIAGDMRAAEMIADRIDGKVPTPIGGSDELGPVIVQIVRYGNDPAAT